MIGWSTCERADLLVKLLLLLLLGMLSVVTSSSTSTISNALKMNSSLSHAHGRLFQTSNRRGGTLFFKTHCVNGILSYVDVGRFSTPEEMNQKPANARRLSGQYLCRWNQEICQQEPISFLMGPDCCNSACTDVKTDIFNCGSCGRICFYGSICCDGDCVDMFNDINHCGSCLSRCAAESSCQFGICGYP